MHAKENLTCQYCNEIYKHPITLPCGDNICKQHIKELTSNSSSFTCPLCDEEHANQSFKVNKLIQKLIESNMHKFEIEPRFKKAYESLKTEIQKFEYILKDPENIIYEEISELKRQVDLDREKLKVQVDALANDLIQQLDSYEAKFKADYKANIDLKHYNDLVESSKKQLAEYEQCLSLFSTTHKELKEQGKQSERLAIDLQQKIAQLKRTLFSNIFLSYEPIQYKIESSYGKLIIKNKKEFLGKAKMTIDAQTGALLVLENGDLVSSTSDYEIKIWDTNNGALKQTLTGHSDWISDIISTDDSCLISASDDNTIKIWYLNKSAIHKTLKGHTDTVFALKLLKNGDLASASADKTIKIWNIKERKLKRTLTGHKGDVQGLVLLKNGDLASASDDKSIKIWDVESGKVKRTLKGHSDAVYKLVLLENGDLVSGSEDCTIKIWDVEKGTVKRTLTGHTEYIFALQVLDNGLLASASEDCSIKLWNIEDGTLLKSIIEPEPVYSLAKLKNGCLVSGCMNGRIKIWD